MKIKIGSYSSATKTVAIASYYSSLIFHKSSQIITNKAIYRGNIKSFLQLILLFFQTTFAQLQNTFIDSVYPYQNLVYSQSNETIKIFDVLGNEVATLVDEYKPAGMYNEQFTMYNLASGIYFYQLKTGEFIQTKKMILMK